MMDAGRELDALVAERVMGWTVQLIVTARDAFEEWRDLQGWRYGSCPPPYSTDIAAAWQVVEKLDLSVMRLYADERGLIWMAGQDRLSGTSTYGIWIDGPEHNGGTITVDGCLSHGAIADTAPLAICRAALAAVGCEVPA